MTDSPSVILPCPFCGGEAHTNTCRYDEVTVRDQGWTQDIFFGVNCMQCGVSNLGGLQGWPTPEAAIAKWNTRA